MSERIHRISWKLWHTIWSVCLGFLCSRASNSPKSPLSEGSSFRKGARGRDRHLTSQPKDSGVRWRKVQAVKRWACAMVSILRPKEDTHKFVVLLLRWIVERTFSWIENYRRMTINKERCSESAETMLYLTFCHILLKKSTDKFKTASQNTM